MKRIVPLFLILALIFTGCNKTTPDTPVQPTVSVAIPEGGVEIALSNEGITVDGAAISTDSTQAVYAANDIIYYEAGHDFTYGEGSPEEEHSPEAAAAHTVVHIAKAGTYRLSGTLGLGQIAVDLGEDAGTDPTAVVNLVLDGVDITCEVAPAIIFYNVYECGSTDAPAMDVDTSAAGANVFLSDGSENNINGSHVARIYKSYTLSEDGTEVIDSKKLHKYDAAFYSKMSMNIGGSGMLNIIADNEGLDTELHLTINGGDIRITSGNDGINTNEDGVSVTAINGGSLAITVDGGTGEGDGIDSNGWLVINGGTVTAYACGSSMDSGIDADNGVYINGGTVIATGNMNDRLQGSQTYAVFSFAEQQSGHDLYSLKNEKDKTALTAEPVNAFSSMIVSSPQLAPGTYTLWRGDEQLGGIVSEGGFGGMTGGIFDSRPPQGFGGFDGQAPEGFEGFNGQAPEDFEGFNGQAPEGFEGFNGQAPEGEFTPPEGSESSEDTPYFVYPIPEDVPSREPGEDFEFSAPQDGFTMPPPENDDGFEGFEPPEGFEDSIQLPEGSFGNVTAALGTLSSEFVIKAGGNFFNFVAPFTSN